MRDRLASRAEAGERIPYARHLRRQHGLPRIRKSLEHVAARLCFVGLGKLHAHDAASAPRNRAAANRRIKKGIEDRHNNLIVAFGAKCAREKWFWKSS